MFAQPRLLAHWVADSIRNRRQFASTVESLRTVPLRFSVTNLGAKLMGTGETTVRLAGSADPITVRKGTHDIYAVMEMFLWGAYRPATEWKLSPSPFIVDFGGNIGLASRYFAGFWPDAQFLIVEPDDGNMKLLKANCSKQIQAGKMRIEKGFVSQQVGSASLDRSRGTLGYRLDEASVSENGHANGTSSEAESIPCLSPMSLLADSPETIDLLKCDIEGAEAGIFKDCKDWIGRVSHLIVETHPPYDPKQLVADLEANGWTCRIEGSSTGQTVEGGHNQTVFLRRTN